MLFDPTVDQPGLFTGTIEFILGIIFFPLIFCAVSNFLKNSLPGRKFCKKFDIKTNGILDIGNKLTSSTFAFLACMTGMTVARQCNVGNELTDRYYVLDNYLIFGFSYFFYDIVSMYMVFSTEHKEEVCFGRLCCCHFNMFNVAGDFVYKGGDAVPDVKANDHPASHFCPTCWLPSADALPWRVRRLPPRHQVVILFWLLFGISGIFDVYFVFGMVGQGTDLLVLGQTLCLHQS